MLDDRKLDVLRAIVEDFVSTNEPVGSKALVERHQLGVSPATVRNDMASLEEEGYIAQPHTSAGRVPTDKGYRLFVDRLSAVKPLSAAERRAIDTFLSGAVDLDDIIRRTVRLLAQLTRQVAVVQYPVLDRSRVRHVELVPLSSTRVMLVVITDTGRVEQRIVEMPASVGDEAVADLRARLNARLSGQLISDAAGEVQEVIDTAPAASQPAATAVAASVLETLVERHDDRIVLAGTANLPRLAADFAGSIGGVLEALEENVILIRLLGETTDTGAVRVRIGEENPHEGLWGAAVVSTGYGTDDHALAGMGVLGPTRMDYPGTMGAVRAVARYVGRILAEN